MNHKSFYLQSQLIFTLSKYIYVWFLLVLKTNTHILSIFLCFRKKFDMWRMKLHFFINRELSRRLKLNIFKQIAFQSFSKDLNPLQCWIIYIFLLNYANPLNLLIVRQVMDKRQNCNTRIEPTMAPVWAFSVERWQRTQSADRQLSQTCFSSSTVHCRLRQSGLWSLLLLLPPCCVVMELMRRK